MNKQMAYCKKRVRVAPCFFAATLGLLLCVFSSSPLFAANEKTTGRLIVDDVLARPGKPAMLKARLVQDGLLGVTGLGGETIRFVVMGQHVGTALTGGDGRAFLEYKTQMRGNHPINGEVEPSPRVNAATGLGNYASWERRKPILFVDVVTLFKAGEGGAVLLPALPMFNAVKWGEPDEDAPGELTKLGKFYFNIIYLLRGDKGNLETLRAWLKTSEFPPGITRVIQPGPAKLLVFIEQLKEGGWDNIEAGIGQTKGFADTLVKNRIKAVIFPNPSKKEKFPRRAKIVSTWKEVRKHL
jgi:hypothetical protein